MHIGMEVNGKAIQLGLFRGRLGNTGICYGLGGYIYRGQAKLAGLPGTPVYRHAFYSTLTGICHRLELSCPAVQREAIRPILAVANATGEHPNITFVIGLSYVNPMDDR